MRLAASSERSRSGGLAYSKGWAGWGPGLLLVRGEAVLHVLVCWLRACGGGGVTEDGCFACGCVQFLWMWVCRYVWECVYLWVTAFIFVSAVEQQMYERLRVCLDHAHARAKTRRASTAARPESLTPAPLRPKEGGLGEESPSNSAGRVAGCGGGEGRAGLYPEARGRHWASNTSWEGGYIRTGLHLQQSQSRLRLS